MSFRIVIGDDAQPASFRIVIGSTPNVADWSPITARPIRALRRPALRLAFVPVVAFVPPPAVPSGVATFTRPSPRVPPRLRLDARPRTFRPPTQPIVTPPASSWLPVRAARYPARDPGRHARSRVFRAPAVIADASVAPIGDPGVSTFAMAVEAGATVTLEWATDVHPEWSGKEKRHSILRRPRTTFEFRTLLTDAQYRQVISELAGEAASAPIFLVALAHEDLTVGEDATGTSIPVSSLAFCDWAQGGRRIVVVSPSGAQADAIVQTAGGSAIVTTTDVSAVAVRGARIMPAQQVYLDPKQALSRFSVNAGYWTLVAHAQRPLAVPTVGVGATVNSYDGLPVWDVGIQIEEASQPLASGVSLVDVGMRVGAVGWQTEADWMRTLRLDGRSQAEWQWLKAFLEAVRGRWKTFLLPSGRPDLVPVGDASAGTLVVEGGAAGQPNYVTDWFPSLAHRRLKLVKTDGGSAYRKVSSCIDNGNGTQSLTLDSPLAGALGRVELLEQARLQNDSVSVTFRGTRFEFTETAKVVQT